MALTRKSIKEGVEMAGFVVHLGFIGFIFSLWAALMLVLSGLTVAVVGVIWALDEGRQAVLRRPARIKNKGR